MAVAAGIAGAGGSLDVYIICRVQNHIVRTGDAAASDGDIATGPFVSFSLVCLCIACLYGNAVTTDTAADGVNLLARCAGVGALAGKETTLFAAGLRESGVDFVCGANIDIVGGQDINIAIITVDICTQHIDVATTRAVWIITP